jgi:hypothetical protein
MTRMITTLGAAGIVLSFAGGLALAQPAPAIPHNQVTPPRYKQHPRPVPEPQTIDALNAMSLDAARRGINFTPPPPGSEHDQPGGSTARP